MANNNNLPTVNVKLDTWEMAALQVAIANQRRKWTTDANVTEHARDCIDKLESILTYAQSITVKAAQPIDESDDDTPLCARLVCSATDL